MRSIVWWMAGLGGCMLRPALGGTSDSAETDVASDTDSSSDPAGKFLVPIYDATEDLPPTYEADLSAITEVVLDRQGLGENLPELDVLDGLVWLDDDRFVRLFEAYKVECPEDVPDCDVTDSEALGVGENALLADLGSLQIRDQGERSTCVSFAINAAFELAYAREHTAIDLSEQNTYLQGKAIEQDWDVAGLYPDVVLEGLAERPVPLVEEQYWPYNRYNFDCAAYHAEYPEATCSETEAQGGGDELHDPDPTVLTAPGYQIVEGHRLYASLGRIKQALYRGYPVVATINSNSDFVIATFKDGVVSWVIRADSCSSVCGHAVAIVGYQDDPDVDGGGYVIIKNSWDDYWGDGGFAYATYEWVENSLLDASAIAAVR